MEVKINVKMYNLEDVVTRDIVFDDDIKMTLFCEYLIVAMNGSAKKLYRLENEYNYIYLGKNIVPEADNEEAMGENKMSYLNLKKGEKYYLDYDFDKFWEFDIKVISVLPNNCKKIFEIIDGKGFGINEKLKSICELQSFKYLIDNGYDKEQVIKEYKGFDLFSFDILQVNKNIDNYLNVIKERENPKTYEINVSLDGFRTKIKRKFLVNGDVLLNTLCEVIILSMNGDLSHLYSIKVNKEYLSEYIKNYCNLNWLELHEKQKFKIIYDYGDNWNFIVMISKVIDGYSDEKIKYIKGKGYGIIEDCGGVYGLANIFDGSDEYREKEDINNYDEEEIINIINNYFN